jgi:hypothetical protein
VKVPRHPQPINIDAGECICIGQSYKYRNGRLEEIFEDSGLVKVDSWTDASNETALFLLKKSSHSLSNICSLGAYINDGRAETEKTS